MKGKSRRGRNTLGLGLHPVRVFRHSKSLLASFKSEYKTGPLVTVSRKDRKRQGTDTG